jgi:hypothetical protein
MHIELLMERRESFQLGNGIRVFDVELHLRMMILNVMSFK